MTTPQVLLVGTTYTRRAQVEKLAAAAGATLAVVDVDDAREHYGTTPLVLVGDNAGPDVIAAGLTRGDGCRLVLLAEYHDTPTWELAIATSADYVADMAEAGTPGWLHGDILQATSGRPFADPADGD